MAESIEAAHPPGMRRAWIVNHYAFGPDVPAGARHFDLARTLVAKGVDASIFAAGFSHASGREERLTGRRISQVEYVDGVRFVWLRTIPYHGNTWRRQVNMLSFMVVFLLVQARSARPDVIVGSTVHPFAAFGGWVASRLRRARFAFEIRDLWPQTLVDLGAMRVGSPGERLLRWMESFLVRRASVVVTVLPGMRAYLLARGLPADHVAYVPNGVDLAAFDAPTPPEPDLPQPVRWALAEIRRRRAEGRFVVGYLGAFGRVNRVDVLIDAAAEAERREPGRVALLLVGDGAERAALARMADGVPSVSIGGSVPRRYVATILRALDATVVHATYTPVYQYGISFNKLFEYMAAQRPIVFACESAYDPVREVGAGLSVAPDDPTVLATAYLELAAKTPDELAAMGEAGRDYVTREHNIERLGGAFARALEGPSRMPHGDTEP